MDTQNPPAAAGSLAAAAPRRGEQTHKGILEGAACAGEAGRLSNRPAIAAAGVAAPVCSQAMRALRPPQLDTRLRAAADWVEHKGVCADIGCDHGLLGATLLMENRCSRLLAADLSAPSLERARTLLTRLGLSQRATFAVADGLDALDTLPDGRADVICLLGMGGETVAGILRRGKARLRGALLILGAQTEPDRVREALQQVDYRLTGERITDTQGRLYLLMRAEPTARRMHPYSERELLMGPCLLANLPAEWRPWLERRRRLLTAAQAARREAGRGEEADEPRQASENRELAYTLEALRALDAHAVTAGKPGEVRL